MSALWSTPWQRKVAPTAPGTGDVDVWRMDVPGCGGEVETLTGLLSEAEQRRMDAKLVQSKRFEYIAGQAMMRRFLSHCLGIAPAAVVYERGHKGKPHIGGNLRGHPLQFNISHSGGQILFALGMGAELGIDLEQLNPRTGCERVARRAFSPREREQLASAGPALARLRFFQMWTCKEAVVKCSGDGIHSGMSRFSVALSDNGHRASIEDASGNQGKVRGYQVVPLPVGPGFAAALVYDAPARTVRLWQVAAGDVLGNV